MSMEQIIVSVLIINWNTREHLLRCLQSLGRGDLGLGIGEVIVVDNASFDGSAEMVRQEFPSVTLIANKRNLGYAKANNQAAAIAKGSYLLLLNPDTEVLPNAIERLVAFAEAHPEAGAIAPKLVYPDGSVQASVRSFPTPATLLLAGLGLDKLFTRLFATRHSSPATSVITHHSSLATSVGRYRMTWFSYDRIAEVDQPMSSALLVRRKAWEQVGGMDETMPIFFNDVDLCWQLKKAGWRIYFLPEAIVVHHHGASTRLLGIGKVLASHRGLLCFYDKHFRPLMPVSLYVILRGAIGIGSSLRIVAAIVANFWMLKVGRS